MEFHEIPWGSMRFYNVPVNQSIPTEANRGLNSYKKSDKKGNNVVSNSLLGASPSDFSQ
jgi:hypothetical protein